MINNLNLTSLCVMDSIFVVDNDEDTKSEDTSKDTKSDIVNIYEEIKKMTSNELGKTDKIVNKRTNRLSKNINININKREAIWFDKK